MRINFRLDQFSWWLALRIAFLKNSRDSSYIANQTNKKYKQKEILSKFFIQNIFFQMLLQFPLKQKQNRTLQNFNLFQANVWFPNPLKRSENKSFSDTFKGIEIKHLPEMD